MKKKKITNKTEFLFDEYRWMTGYTPKEVEFLAAKNNINCVCYLESTPITHPVWFLNKIKYYA